MLSQTNLSHIPHQPGIYIFKDYKGSILYIGKAKNLNKRVHQYFAPGSVRKQDMMAKADGVEFMVVDNESEALILESNLIKKHLPAYNRLLKGDNSYVYIKITAEPRPQLFFTRNRSNDGAIYIGPKHMRNELKKLLQYLRQILGYRGCKPTQFKQGTLCSDYLFGICKGWCVYAKLGQKNEDHYLAPASKLGFDTHATQKQGKLLSKQMIQLIVDFFNGDTEAFMTHITAEINNCIHSQNFEYAAKLRDIFINLSSLTQKQSVILDLTINGTYCMIRTLGSYYVYCTITIQHGKIVDILRFKEHEDDVSLTGLFTIVELEYGQHYERTQHNNDYVARFGVSNISTDHHAILSQHSNNAIESFVISDSRQSNSVVNDLLSQLQQRYQLHTYPYRIECIDISHLSGGWASGGLSCMVGGMPHKKLYRQYKIPKEIAGNDLASLTHIIVSRFKLDQQEILADDQLPDMFILDGGELQLSILSKLQGQYPKLKGYMQKVQFCGLVKGAARSSSAKTYGEVEQLIVVHLNKQHTSYNLSYDPADHIIIKLRDEAHRFANRYRTKQMSQDLK